MKLSPALTPFLSLSQLLTVTDSTNGFVTKAISLRTDQPRVEARLRKHIISPEKSFRSIEAPRMTKGDDGEPGKETGQDEAKMPAKDESPEGKTTERRRNIEPALEKRRRKDIVNDEARVNEALGLGRGAVLLTIVLLINVWFFSIPTEFRRTRLCNEFDTEAYPELCMTPRMFVNGISEYYKNGGGIKFDFTIQGRD